MLSAKQIFLPEFSNCIVNSSSVARMRAERGTLTEEEEERERERERTSSIQRKPREIQQKPNEGWPRPPRPKIFKILCPQWQAPGPRCPF